MLPGVTTLGISLPGGAARQDVITGQAAQNSSAGTAGIRETADVTWVLQKKELKHGGKNGAGKRLQFAT